MPKENGEGGIAGPHVPLAPEVQVQRPARVSARHHLQLFLRDARIPEGLIKTRSDPVPGVGGDCTNHNR